MYRVCASRESITDLPAPAGTDWKLITGNRRNPTGERSVGSGNWKNFKPRRTSHHYRIVRGLVNLPVGGDQSMERVCGTERGLALSKTNISDLIAWPNY